MLPRLEHEHEVEADEDQDRRRRRLRLRRRAAERCVHEPVPEQDRDAEHEPRREARSRPRRAGSGVGGACAAGASARKNAGMPDGERRGQRELAGKERVGAAADADGQDERRREYRLRDEQLGDALDVAQDLATLLDGEGDRRRSSRSTSTTSATPLAIWLPDPSATATSHSLSAGTSLTPSPIIATRRPPRRSASTSCALLLRLHAREDRVVDRAAAQRARPSSGSSDPVVTRPSVSMPAARATAATVAGPVARDDLDVRRRCGAGRPRSRPRRAACARSARRAARGASAGSEGLVVALGLGQAVRAGEQQHAQAAVLPHGDLLGERGIVLGRAG